MKPSRRRRHGLNVNESSNVNAQVTPYVGDFSAAQIPPGASICRMITRPRRVQPASNNCLDAGQNII
jgi:hypothetical protein